MNKKGTSIAFAVFTLLILSILAVTIFSMLSTDATSAGEMARSMKAFYTAESGKEIGARAIYDDKLATKTQVMNLNSPALNGYCGISYLEMGYGGAWGSWNVTPSNDPKRAMFHGKDLNDATPFAVTMDDVYGAYIVLGNPQQNINLMGSKLLRARMVARVRKKDSAQPNTKLIMHYTLDSAVTWTPEWGGNTTGFVFDITNSSWPADVNSYNYSAELQGLTWQDIKKPGFNIKLTKFDAAAGDIEVDWFALEVVTEVDSLMEPWADRYYSSSNSYIRLPALLGGGIINDIIVEDEAGKINLNDAPRLVMEYLFKFCGMSSSDASTFASAILTYRGGMKSYDWQYQGSNNFDTIEELKKGLNMSEGNFNLIRDYVTVYSWPNPKVYIDKYGGWYIMSPVNINTASENVLKAIFKCAVDTDARAADIAQAVIYQRGLSPFTSAFSSYESQVLDKQSFAGFIKDLNLGWLSDSYRRRLLDVADGSCYNIASLDNWYDPYHTTAPPFCYSSHAFEVTGEGRASGLSRKVRGTYGFLYDYTTYSWNTDKGTFALPTYIGDLNHQAYWRERVR